MPKKPNSHGMQEYVPAGNGDASGEYANEEGNNRHFTSFKKPEEKNDGLTNETNGDTIKPDMNNEYMKEFDRVLKLDNVEYRRVEKHKSPLTEDEIINSLSGGDMTKGSCASLALAYVGQKAGMNVLDFRDGASRSFFATRAILRKIGMLPNVITVTETAKSAVTAGNKLLRRVETGKEYFFCSGKHAAIVRNKDGVMQYLELQSATGSGWQNFNGNPRYTLAHRFGDYRFNGHDIDAFMIEVNSLKGTDNLRYLLGYINTAKNEQGKGKYGTRK